eukprot:COSAG02_NODE_6578_length_3482_cov_5.503104_2_plen_106_part_00
MGQTEGAPGGGIVAVRACWRDAGSRAGAACRRGTCKLCGVRASWSSMVYITEEQIAQYKRDGYLIIPSFLNGEESAAALQGFYDNVRTAFIEDRNADHSTCARPG